MATDTVTINLTSATGYRIGEIDAKRLPEYPEFAVHRAILHKTGAWAVSHIETGAVLGNAHRTRAAAIKEAKQMLQLVAPDEMELALSSVRRVIKKAERLQKRKRPS